MGVSPSTVFCRRVSEQSRDRPPRRCAEVRASAGRCHHVTTEEHAGRSFSALSNSGSNFSPLLDEVGVRRPILGKFGHLAVDLVRRQQRPFSASLPSPDWQSSQSSNALDLRRTGPGTSMRRTSRQSDNQRFGTSLMILSAALPPLVSACPGAIFNRSSIRKLMIRDVAGRIGSAPRQSEVWIEGRLLHSGPQFLDPAPRSEIPSYLRWTAGRTLKTHLPFRCCSTFAT